MHFLCSWFLLAASASAQYLVESSSFGQNNQYVVAVEQQPVSANRVTEFPLMVMQYLAGTYRGRDRLLNWCV